ncbi:MAG: Phosphopantetheine attachment site, partial [Burkholderiales bacterium]|nr:Phosphopantetheine attachment site [Burkholderiales bacterium]
MDTLGRIRQLAAKEFSINPDGLDPSAPLETLGIDSLSVIEFMFKVEEEFG